MGWRPRAAGLVRHKSSPFALTNTLSGVQNKLHGFDIQNSKPESAEAPRVADPGPDRPRPDRSGPHRSGPHRSGPHRSGSARPRAGRRRPARHRAGPAGRLARRPVLRGHRGRVRVPALVSRRAKRPGPGGRLGVPVHRHRGGGRQPHRPGPAGRARQRLAADPRRARDERRERGLRPGPGRPAGQARRLLDLRPGRRDLLARRRDHGRPDRHRRPRHQCPGPGRHVPRRDPGPDRPRAPRPPDPPCRPGRRRHRPGRHPLATPRPARPAGPRRAAPADPPAARAETRAAHPMKDTTLLIAGMATLSAGTLAFRLSGPLLRKRLTFPPWAEKLLEAAAVILLAALVATTALTEGHAFVGPARPAGVLVGGILAWRKAPFLVVILAAAATTAILRLLGVP